VTRVEPEYHIQPGSGTGAQSATDDFGSWGIWNGFGIAAANTGPAVPVHAIGSWEHPVGPGIFGLAVVAVWYCLPIEG